MEKKPDEPQAAVTIHAKDPRLAHVIAGAAAGAAKAYLELDKRDFKRPSLDDEPDADEEGGPADGDVDDAKAKGKRKPIAEMLADDREQTRANTGKK